MSILIEEQDEKEEEEAVVEGVPICGELIISCCGYGVLY
jgi:hypothetical protein